MFGNKAEKAERIEQLNQTNNIIGKGTVITGDIDTYGNIRIDGKIIGNIKAKAKVALGNGSIVEGNITAQNAEIEGEVTGNIDVSEVLVLKPTAVINGNIITGKLVVEAGAKFNGNCRMGEKITEHKVERKIKEPVGEAV